MEPHPVETITVIGSGLMGRGIAHAAAGGGFRTVIHDVSAEALDRAVQQIRRDLDEGVSRGKLGRDDAAAALARLVPEPELRAAAGQAEFVIEAVPEQIELKLRVFASLDEICPPEVVLATNTSALSITEIAAGTARPERVVGMHFFNPVPKMKLVEIIRALETDDATLRRTEGVARRMGKETVLMGPFEMVDLVGLDTRLAVLEFLHQSLGEKYRPAPLLVQYVKAGRLGRKVGRGVYDYEDEK